MSLHEKYANTRFLMIHRTNGNRVWMTFQHCYRALDSGICKDGARAIDIDSDYITERPLTQEEKNDITNASNDYSGSK